MKIAITERYMTTEQLKARNGVPYISCAGAYDKKDALKDMGYQFNSTNKAWELKIDPAHFMDLCAETAIACKLSPDELDEFLVAIGEFQQSPRHDGFCDEFTVDGLDARYNDYCDSIGY